MNILGILLMMPQDGEKGGMMSFLWLFMIIIIFYLFFIRPQMKKGKDQRKFREALQKGSKVITIGGVHGKILEMGETTVIIEVEGQNRLKVEKTAVAMEASESGKLEQKK